MTINEQIDLWLGHAAKAYAGVPYNRDYAKDEPAALAIAAAAAAWQEREAGLGRGFDILGLEKFFQELAELVPELRQRRPNEPEPIPPMPIDPVTQQPAVNPYETGDLESCGILETRFPALARHLKRIAKNKGYTFKHDAELQDANAARAAAKAVKFGTQEFKNSVYRQPNKTKQVEFEKSNPPEVVAFHRRESEPLRVPWQRGHYNMTKVGQLLREAPEVGEVIQRAQKIEEEWLDAKLVAAKAAEAEAQQARQRAEALLQAK